MEFKKVLQFLFQKIFGINIYLYCFGVYRALLKIYFPDLHMKWFMMLANKKDGDILDIGCNVATYSICFGRKMPDKYIIGFEPINILYRIGTSLLRLFRVKNVIIRNEGLGKKIGKATVITPYLQGVYMHGLSHFDDNTNAAYEETPHNKKEEVLFSTVDTYYTESGKRKIAGIKIDVENHELFVIQGALKVLTIERPIVLLELWENNRQQYCEEALRNLGYTRMQIVGSKLMLTEFTEELNYFFIPNEFVESVNL
jgi:FkbM family methyltransferase